MKQTVKWTAEGAGKCGLRRVSRDVRHTLVAGDMKVSRKGTDHTVNQGGTADRELIFVLDRSIFLSGIFCLCDKAVKCLAMLAWSDA